MHVPGRHVVHNIHIIHLADTLVAVRPGKSLARRGLPVLRKPLQLCVDSVLEKIGYRHNPRTGNHRDTMDGARTARANTNARHAHLAHGLKRKALHRRTGRPKQLQRIA